MDVVDMINSFAEWCHETDEGCIVVTGDDRVLPFLSWDEAKHYYRERSRLLDQSVSTARFFVRLGESWDEVRAPAFAN